MAAPLIGIRTSDGTIHSANRWDVALEMAYPVRKAGATLGMLISVCQKEHGIDATFAQAITEENAPHILARLHECGIVTLVQ